MLLSVVTPFLCELPVGGPTRDGLRAWLAALAVQEGPLELVFAATAASRRGAWEPLLADLAGAGFPHRIRALHLPANPPALPYPTRAAAMNLAAGQARGPVVLLLHADCLLPAGGAASIRAAWRAGYRAGAFPKRYDDPSPALALQEAWLNEWRLRRRRRAVGTNAIWLASDLMRASPLPDWAMLEDFALSERLRRLLGSDGIHVASAPVVVSAAKYRRTGIVASMAVNASVLALHRLGVSPEVLRHEVYSRRRLAVGSAYLWPSLAAAVLRAWRRR